MELEIPSLCGGGSVLPGWSKTGRRTRATRAHHQGLLTTTSDDEARGLSILENDEFVAENLPPKKRKLDSAAVVGGNDVSARNGKDLSCRERKQHTCNICTRSFSSYQALGGHKAHHNGLKDHKGTLAADDADAVLVCGAGAVHRCTYCYKVFSKGQALGGHRRHCQRLINENRQKVFSFDLNKLPPDWLES